jgi:hypothetical protein
MLGLATVSLAVGIAVASPVSAFAAGDQASSRTGGFGQHWLARLDPNLQIPTQLALKFGRAAVAGGLTGGQALAMLNDQRFAAAVGSPDQGYGLLEAMIQHPSYIQKAYVLLADRHYTASGADSLQTAIMSVVPELRNAYLEDLGLMAVDNGSGVLVLVDIETGRQYIGQGMLGAQLRAPGRGPIPSPSISPEGAAVQMWAEAARAAATPSPGPRGPLGAPGAARADLSGALRGGSTLPLFCLGRLRRGRGAPAPPDPLSRGTASPFHSDVAIGKPRRMQA